MISVCVPTAALMNGNHICLNKGPRNIARSILNLLTNNMARTICGHAWVFELGARVALCLAVCRYKKVRLRCRSVLFTEALFTVCFVPGHCTVV